MSGSTSVNERVTNRRRAPVSLFTAVSATVAAILAFLALYPLMRVLVRLVWADGQLNTTAVSELIAMPDLGRVIGATILVVGLSSGAALAVGSFMAWLNERTDARIGVLGDVFSLVPFLLPAIAGAFGWVLLLSPRAGLLNAAMRSVLDGVGINLTEGPLNIYTWWGLIFVYTIYQVPYVYLMVSAGLRNLDPVLEEQARVCGRGRLMTLVKVTLPGVRPSLGGAILLMIWSGFALFSVPFIIGTGADIEVLSVRVVNLLRFTYPPKTDLAVALSVVILLFVGVAYWAQVRVLKSGRSAAVSGKGFRRSLVALGRWRQPARLVFLCYVLVSTVLPVLGLAFVALNGFWTPNIQWSELGFDAIRRTLIDDPSTSAAIGNSLLLGVTGATVGIVCAALVALLVQRSSGRLSRSLDAAIKLPASIANIVIAVGFVLAFAGPPFRLAGTLLLLLLAYLVLYMPQASVAADTAANQVGRELTEAARMGGAGGFRSFVRISLPLMTPGLLSGWSLLFVRMVGDLTASSILAGTSNNVVGFRVLELAESGSFAVLAALSIALTLASSVVVVTVYVITRRQARWQRQESSPPLAEHRNPPSKRLANRQ